MAVIKVLGWLLGVSFEPRQSSGAEQIQAEMNVAAESARNRLIATGQLQAAEEAQRRVRERVRVDMAA